MTVLTHMSSSMLKAVDCSWSHKQSIQTFLFIFFTYLMAKWSLTCLALSNKSVRDFVLSSLRDLGCQHSRWCQGWHTGVIKQVFQMSSDNDEGVLQKHQTNVGTSLAGTKVRGRAEGKHSRRQSKELPSSIVSNATAGSRRTRGQQPARKAAATATASDDSDDDSHLLESYSNKPLLVVKVCQFPCLVQSLHCSFSLFT